MDNKDDTTNNIENRLSVPFKANTEDEYIRVHKKALRDVMMKYRELEMQHNDLLALAIRKTNENAKLFKESGEFFDAAMSASKRNEALHNEIDRLYKEKQKDKEETVDSDISDSDIENIYDEEKKKTPEKESDSILKKSWDVLNTPLEDIWDKVKSFGDDAPSWKLDMLVDYAEQLTMLSAKGIGWLLDKTFGKVLSFFGANSKLLSTYIMKTVSTFLSVMRWVYNVAKKTIQFIWDKFVMLAKIGWKVISIAWDILSTPINIIYDIFKETLLAIITNPLGLVLMTMAFFYAMRFAVTYLWPQIKNFIINTATIVWTWIKETTAALFFSGDVSAMEKFFGEKYEMITGWLKDVGKKVLSMYDRYIGSKIGLESKEIINFFSGNNNIFTTIFDNIVHFFTNIFSQDLIDEVIFSFTALKAIAKKLLFFTGVDTKDPKEQEKIDAIEAENDTRLTAILSHSLFDYAKSEVLKTMYEEYLKHSSLEPTVLSNLLIKTGKAVIENIQKTSLISSRNSKVNDMQEKVLSTLDDSFLKTLASNIIIKKDKIGDTLQEYSKKQKHATHILTSVFKQYGDILASGKEDLDVATDVKKMIDKFSNISFEVYNNTLTDSIELTDKGVSVELTTLVNKDIKTLMVSYEDRLDENNRIMAGMTLDIGKEINEKTLAKIKEKFMTAIPTINVALIRATILKERKNIPQASLEIEVNRILNQRLAELLPQKSIGSLATGAVPVIVGEGKDPELILPINIAGLEFIKNSMGAVIEKLNTGDGQTEEQTPNIVKQVMKNMIPKKDMKIYDMKNISSNQVMIG